MVKWDGSYKKVIICPEPASWTLISGIIKAGFESGAKCKWIRFGLLGYGDVDEKSVKSNQAYTHVHFRQNALKKWNNM